MTPTFWERTVGSTGQRAMSLSRCGSSCRVVESSSRGVVYEKGKRQAPEWKCAGSGIRGALECVGRWVQVQGQRSRQKCGVVHHFRESDATYAGFLGSSMRPPGRAHPRSACGEWRLVLDDHWFVCLCGWRLNLELREWGHRR